MTKTNFPQYAIDEVEKTIESVLEVVPAGLVTREQIAKEIINDQLRGVQYFGNMVLKYAISLLPESEQAEFIAKLPESKPVTKFQVKSQPVGFSKICSKCTGTGLYIQWIDNGKACSNTGTTCYKCNGRGWTK